jgi:hypothetical protein
VERFAYWLQHLRRSGTGIWSRCDRMNRIHRKVLSRTNPPSILSILYILSKKQAQLRLNGVATSSSPRGRPWNGDEDVLSRTSTSGSRWLVCLREFNR